MSLNAAEYKKEKSRQAAADRKCKQSVKELHEELEKMSGLSLKEFQRSVIQMMKFIITAQSQHVSETSAGHLEAGKSFGTIEQKFSDVEKLFDCIIRDLNLIKVNALINTLIVQEKLVLNRPISMDERRSIFGALNIDYDEFANTANKTQAHG